MSRSKRESGRLSVTGPETTSAWILLPAMKVPLTVNDFLERAELVYGDRIGVVDEPDQPAASWGELTYRRMAELARAQAAGLDALGVGQGERVAIVSQNSARLLTSFFGVSGYGRILVPINFRLNADEVAYIVEHSRRVGAARRSRARRARSPASTRKHRFVIGAETDDELLPRSTSSPSRGTPDEDATATINYTSGTTARPKGVQLTHRNLWLNAATFGWHTRRQRPRRLPAHAADVPLQRLGHAVRGHRHGRHAHRAAQGRRRRDPAPRRRARRHAAVRRAGGRRDGPRRRARRGTARSRARAACAWSWPARRRRRARSSGSRPSSAGSSSRSTASPRRRRCSR